MLFARKFANQDDRFWQHLLHTLTLIYDRPGCEIFIRNNKCIVTYCMIGGQPNHLWQLITQAGRTLDSLKVQT